jgi:hypothetical protein
LYVFLFTFSLFLVPEYDESSSIMISASSEPEPIFHKPEPVAPQAGQPEIVLRHCEMSPEVQERAMQLILQGFLENESEGQRAVAGSIKKLFDSEFGIYWHCIVGKSYASHVSHGKQKQKDLTPY